MIRGCAQIGAVGLLTSEVRRCWRNDKFKLQPWERRAEKLKSSKKFEAAVALRMGPSFTCRSYYQYNFKELEWRRT